MSCFGMTLFCIIAACLLSSCTSLTRLMLSVNGTTADEFVLIGSRVTISCEPRGIWKEKKQPLVIKRPDRILSERCDSFESRFQLNCEPDNTWENARAFHLTIEKVAWVDRGIWLCAIGANITTIDLRVYSPPKILGLRIRVENVRPDAIQSSTNAMTNSNYMGHRFVSFSQNDMESRYGSRSPPGSGTINHPYDLRPFANNSTFAVRVTCNASCSYPLTQFVWTIRNKTDSERILDVSSSLISSSFHSQSLTQQCDKDMETTNMVSSRSDWYLDCNNLPLTGTVSIACTPNTSQYLLFGDSYVDGSVSAFSHIHLQKLRQTVHVICPGGKFAPHLLPSEILAMVFAAFLALLLVTCLVAVLRYDRKPDIVNDFSYGVSV